jgi:threonine/homoserine/homoserine lactone efflux protein
VTPTTIALFGLATLILTATPGPGVLFVWARSLSQGRRAGFASMFGIEFGEMIWLAATATGLAALLATSAATLTFLRFGGAAYLIYLGVQRWRHAEPVLTPRPTSHRRIFVQGLVTQLLNPKVAVFFIAFLPQFLDPRQQILPQVATLGAVYIGVALMVDTTYVLATSAMSRRVLASRVAQKRTAMVAAGTYLALGVAALVVGERPAR